MSVALSASDALAIDLPPVAGEDVTLDVTETSIVAQRFNARDGERAEDQGYFAWLNRLNGVLSWKRFTLGARIDSGLYALRPEDRTFDDPQLANNARIDGSTRYRNGLYLAKIYLTYKTPDAEITVGDNYVQFGRGLILSMRKVDELGIDTTLLGAKITATKSVFGFTAIAGIANPARIDEPSGRALFIPKDLGDSRGPQPLFGNDRILGASVTVGRTLPVVLSTNAVFLTRCAPYRYDDATGRINDGTFDRPIGTCDDGAVNRFLGTLPDLGPAIGARHIANASQTLEIPSIWGHGNLYIEGAVQKRSLENPRDADTQGNAIYGAFTSSGGPITNTLEVKSYRNYWPLAGSVNISRASAFANIAYSAPPTTEPVVADSMFNNFNVCVTGGHDRLDYRLTNSLLVYLTAGYWSSLGEQPGGQCDSKGRNTASDKATSSDRVVDVSVGTEWRFDADQSYVFMNLTARDDIKGDGNAYYREVAFQHTFSKHIKGPYSLELAGRHRYRVQDSENIGPVYPGNHDNGNPWTQGEEYLALKIAPKWIWTIGYEYTSQSGFPSDYFNGGVLYKFTSDSNIRLYAGQNRGGLRCVSGICRVFPSFDGARAELTLRF